MLEMAGIMLVKESWVRGRDWWVSRQRCKYWEGALRALGKLQSVGGEKGRGGVKMSLGQGQQTLSPIFTCPPVSYITCTAS